MTFDSIARAGNRFNGVSDVDAQSGKGIANLFNGICRPLFDHAYGHERDRQKNIVMPTPDEPSASEDENRLCNWCSFV